MEKAAYIALLLMFVILGGGMILAAGEHPIRAVLIVGGLLLILVRGNAIVDRGSRRLGKAAGFTGNPLDVRGLKPREWLELLATFAVGATAALCGLTAFRGGA